MNLTFPDLLSVISLNAILVFFASKWIEARLTASIKAEYDRKLADYQAELRRREQAARVAKLLALRFQDELPAHEFNELAWEVSLWLPADRVRDLTTCLCGVEGAMQPKEMLISIRKLLHGPDDNLTADQIVHKQNVPAQMPNQNG